MIRYIDRYRGHVGVERICRVLNEAEGGFITSRGYRAAKTRVRSPRDLKDDMLSPEIQRTYPAHYSVYVVRKMWRAMRRRGCGIGRDQTYRLMLQAGVTGAVRGRKPQTTVPVPVPDHPLIHSLVLFDQPEIFQSLPALRERRLRPRRLLQRGERPHPDSGIRKIASSSCGSAH